MIQRLACLTFVAVTFLACGADSAEPLDVAGDFWEAARSGDDERVRGLASARTATGLVPGGRARFDDLVLTDARVEGEAAVVQTTMTLRNEGGRALRITFPTHLVRENESWRVAVDETMTAAMWSAHGAALADSARSDGDSLVARDTAR